MIKTRPLQGLDSKSLEVEIAVILESVRKLAKKRRLPEEIVIALLRDRLEAEAGEPVENKHLRNSYQEIGSATYSGRTPTWVKLVVSLLSKEDKENL